MMKKPVALLVASILTASAFAGSIGGYERAYASSSASADMELAEQYGWLTKVGINHASDEVTRLDMAVLLANALNLRAARKEVQYEDVPRAYQGIVNSVVEAGLMRPVRASRFASNRELTREAFAEIVALEITNGRLPRVDTSVLNNFVDGQRYNDTQLLAYAVLKGILDLQHGTALRGQDTITLGEAVYGLKPLVFEDLDIISTNDIHGNIEFNTTFQNGGMAIIGGIVNQFRSINPKGTIVLDAGDFFQGTLISNSTEGASTTEAMNTIGYDAGTVGNHEFDFGVKVLKDRIAQAKFPIVSANIIDEATGKLVSWTKPYTIVEKDGYRIGVVGLSTVQTATTTLSTHIKGLSFPNGAPIAQELLEEVKDAGADFVILNSHLPGDVDKNGKIFGELADFAATTKGFSAVVGGHSHKRVAGYVNNVPVVEAQSYTAALGHIRLYVDKETDKIVSSEVEILETKKGLAQEDYNVKQVVDKENEKIAKVKNEVVSVLGEKLTRDSVNQIKRGKIDKDIAREGVTPLGNLITDVMRETEGVDIAFTNIGGIRTDLVAGELTYAEWFEVMPFDNYNVNGEMNAEQLKKVLEVVDKYSKLPALQVSGLKYKWDNTRPQGDKIVEITLTDGTPIYVSGTFSNKKFTVTTNNFLGTGSGDGYVVFGEVNWTETTNFQREIVADYLRKMHKEGKKIYPVIDDRETRLDAVK